MRNFFCKADIKKIDIGGGVIHGRAEDFVIDKSSKIILSHTSCELTNSQKEIGSNATFGMEDVLIPAQQDYSMRSAFRYLRAYFTKVPPHDLNMLLNCPVESLNVGLIIIKKGEINKDVYLILNGVVEYIDSNTKRCNMLSSGTILGEYSVLNNEVSYRTYRTMSYIKVLRIPGELYLQFIKHNFDYEHVKRIHDDKNFLQGTDLFGEMVSSMIHNRITTSMQSREIKKGEEFVIGNEPCIFLLKKGEAVIYLDDKEVDKLKPGGFYGEESVFYKQAGLFKCIAKKKSTVYIIAADIIKNIPIVEWKLLETFERRLRAFGSQFED